MILDSENQRKFLLNMIEGVTFPGSVLDLAYETKKAILRARLADRGGELATESARECNPLEIVKNA